MKERGKKKKKEERGFGIPLVALQKFYISQKLEICSDNSEHFTKVGSDDTH